MVVGRVLAEGAVLQNQLLHALLECSAPLSFPAAGRAAFCRIPSQPSAPDEQSCRLADPVIVVLGDAVEEGGLDPPAVLAHELEQEARRKCIWCEQLPGQ